MKRKVYATSRERKADQIKGFWAFPIVNVPLWIVSQMIYSQLPTRVAMTDLSSFMLIRGLVSALPWLVNGIVLVLAFLFRPGFGVGYVAFIAIAITVVTALSVLFVAACFMSVVSTLVIGPLAIALFVVLMSGGLYYLAIFAHRLFRDWQSSHENISHEGGGSKNG